MVGDKLSNNKTYLFIPFLYKTLKITIRKIKDIKEIIFDNISKFLKFNFKLLHIGLTPSNIGQALPSKNIGHYIFHSKNYILNLTRYFKSHKSSNSPYQILHNNLLFENESRV